MSEIRYLEGIDAVREAVKELEAAGYVTREQRRGERGCCIQEEGSLIYAGKNSV